MLTELISKLIKSEEVPKIMSAIQANLNLFCGSFSPQMVETSGATRRFETIPQLEISDDRYVIRLARTLEEIDAVLRLRYEIFNLELGEGLDASHITGRDEDEFDAICHHLVVIERKSGTIVGTYRVQTLEMACSPLGFYSAGEFRIEDLPSAVLAASLELGRACIVREHRHTRVLFLLWRGLAAYAEMNNKRYLFGCCSLTSQDCGEGLRAARFIKSEGYLNQRISVAPRTDYLCEQTDFFAGEDEEIKLPKLFLTYLRFGAKVCSPPAIDRRFKAIDFLILFDIVEMVEKYRRMFFVNS